jgi:hypothetical protein
MRRCAWQWNSPARRLADPAARILASKRGLVLGALIHLMFRTLARRRWPRAAARLLILTSRPMAAAQCRGEPPLRALVMAKEGFNEDVAASLGAAGEFEILSAPRNAIKGLAAGILSREVDDNRYLTDDPEIEASKLAYRQFLRAMWREVGCVKPIHVVLSGNFGYYAEREFAAALEEEGTPFIVLHKENMKSPGRVAFFRSVYSERRGRFGGRRVLVYNAVERDLQIASGVARVDQIIVTGMPRLDRVHEWRRENAGTQVVRRPQVLFFSFWHKSGLPLLARKPRTSTQGDYERLAADLDRLSWETLATETHQAMIALARERPDARIIIKSKGRSREFEDTFRMLGGKIASLPPNLEVVVGGDPFDLLTASSVVVGFNTTGLLEGVATGKPVVVPWFGELSAAWAKDYVIDLGTAVEYAHSPRELLQLIGQHLDDPRPVPGELPKAAMEILNQWLGNADGGAGARIVTAVKSEICCTQTQHAKFQSAAALETDA